MCASRLIVTRRISAPIAELWRSFQRDSAFLTLKGCHYTRSRPAMATGRPLVISLARYATPIRQYSVFPQS